MAGDSEFGIDVPNFHMACRTTGILTSQRGTGASGFDSPGVLWDLKQLEN